MTRITILSFHSGKYHRGVETWAENLHQRLSPSTSVRIISGWNSFNPLVWFPADIVISTNGRLQVLIARLATWIVCRSLVVFGHSGLGADDKWNLLCSPDMFVCFSDFQRQWADKLKFPWTRITVINHAVDTRLFCPAPQKPKQNVVLCVAANEPDRRVDLVRNAIRLLPHSRLIVVGRGQPREVDHSEMPQIYRQADVFCFVPQAWEAFGLVYLEALASNLPVVAPNDPIRREIIGPAGILVDDPQNPHQLAQALRAALSTDWKDVPRRQAQKFSWNRTVKKYRQLCQNLTS